MKKIISLIIAVISKFARAIRKQKTFTAEMVPLCEEAAKKHNVIPDIHPNDFIFKFLLNHPNFFKDSKLAVSHYFDDGAQSANKLMKIIHGYHGQTGKQFQLLEFASGYGCVTRHLPRFLPKDSITSCDIHVEAIDFIREKIGNPVILSNSVPEKLDLPSKYDVIFALSFFSHMPKKTWARWLNVLFSKLMKDGHLIFTTHGLQSMKHLNNPQLDSEGFWFKPVSEQGDLETAEYGSTIVDKKFVYKICEEAGIKNIVFHEAYWWRHQDLYILKKP